MKKILILICLFGVTNIFAQSAKNDAVFNAMQEEMKRRENSRNNIHQLNLISSIFNAFFFINSK